MVENQEIYYEELKPEDEFSFQCKNCGECCRKVKNGVMLESLDLFRIAQHLEQDIGTVINKYTEMQLLVWGYPVFLLKTTDPSDTCIFLKNNKCSIHFSKPKTCRIYPLGVGPDAKTKDNFLYYMVSKEEKHLQGKKQSVKSWFDQYLTKEDRDLLNLDYRAAQEIGKILRQISDDKLKDVVKLVLLFKYFNFDIDQDFKMQFLKNMAQLKILLQDLI